MRYEKWEISGFDRGAAVELCRKGINPLISVFLTSRAITDIEDVRALLDTQLKGMYDPLLMADMDKAVACITDTVKRRRRIAIYGDYDADGMTSCALLALWLSSKGADFEIYIPGRFDEGYGLNCAALDALKSRGAELVITVDCGVTAIEEAQYARELGMSLIITDHHECRAELPQAEAVVDPKRPDCAYPNKALAGVGVAFKLVCALENGVDTDEMFRRYGDLVAIGTIADVMPVVGENQEMIKQGIKTLNNNPRLGLRKLLKEIYSERGIIDTATIGFALVPRLNAAGRMNRTSLSVELLLTQEEEQAEQLSAELDKLNFERRRLESEIYEEASMMLPEHETDGPVVLARRGWYQGVTGIVAAKMAERLLVPVIIISIDDDGTGRGSCRSFGKFGIYDALSSCEGLLLTYGGHEMAAGVTIAEENINELRRQLKRYYIENAKTKPEPGLQLDFEVEKPELLTISNIEAMEGLEPYGSGNPPPCLCMKNAVLTSVVSIGEGKHTRLKLEKMGKSLDCIYFSMPAQELGVSEGMLVDVAFEPKINKFRNRSSVQLHLFDIKAASNEGMIKGL